MFRISNPESAVLLELHADGMARSLVFRPGEERGVVVGSTPLADFRVTGVRVAPVEFHLERITDGIWLIPAYGVRDLRLNAARVSGPTSLEAHNVIEFGGVRLNATVSEASMLDQDAGVAPGAYIEALLGSTYSVDLPSDLDATQEAMPRAKLGDILAGIGSPGAIKGVACVPVTERDPADLLENTTQRLAASVPHAQPQGALSELTDNGTEIIPAYRATAAPRSPHEARAAASARAGGGDGIYLVPLSNAPRPRPLLRSPQPAAADGTSTTPSVAMTSPMSASVGRERAQFVHHARPAPNVLPRPPRVSWLARLGLLTRAHPFLVGCCAGLGAFAVGVLPLVAVRAVRERERIAFSRSTLLGRPAISAGSPSALATMSRPLASKRLR